MKKETEKKILEIINENHGYLRTGDLLKQGISNAYIKTFIIKGILTPLKRGLYRLTDKKAGESLAEIQAIIPSGIFCLGTALEYYGLTTFLPPEYHVAIESKDRVRLPEYPPVRLFYFSKKIFQEGIEEKIADGMPFRIYSRERTLCDAVKFRSKLGKDIVMESIKNYMKLKDRNIPKLYEYSRILRVEKLITNYLEILV